MPPFFSAFHPLLDTLKNLNVWDYVKLSILSYRFGLLVYGSIILAIYMNGICQEV
ncbi:hypothetical protein Cri9333_2190 [Crinalium epipsammum PCC 9333]|uniref:Uncharacterized protein n=1 Tax=Crinalium epipsammum PCC 9333 TaxID=1173022 RepID=K9W001_9CYAN|nr:hypothetical protein [Crinalium epipsammum]AFZ13062.1 hypothetical protein Cri9333_2190 [Crinalium epipsammum PCC 9333]